MLAAKMLNEVPPSLNRVFILVGTRRPVLRATNFPVWILWAGPLVSFDNHTVELFGRSGKEQLRGGQLHIIVHLPLQNAQIFLVSNSQRTREPPSRENMQICATDPLYDPLYDPL